MKSKKAISKITSPDELNKGIESTSIFTWVVLFAVILSLIGFFVWSCVVKVTYKVMGTASITGGEVTLKIDENKLSKIKQGQIIHISNQEKEIEGIKEDGYPIIPRFDLDDGNYDYYIVIKEMRPIEYFFN